MASGCIFLYCFLPTLNTQLGALLQRFKHPVLSIYTSSSRPRSHNLFSISESNPLPPLFLQLDF